MNKKVIIYTLIAFFLSVGLLLVGFDTKASVEPQDVYRVYLEGKSIGLINSKQELEDLIDQKQNELKSRYNVDKVYLPKNLDIVKEVTYNEKIYSSEYIYNKIKNITPFTINGYTITIKGIKEMNAEGKEITTPTKKIYVLDKKIFTESVDKTIRSFIPSEDYDAFLNEKQKEIQDTGKIIEDVYIENDITIKKDNIPVNEMIFTTVEDLSKYLLFGTLEDQKKYTVQAGDTIEDVSFANKISTEEFLIANPSFQDKDSLLFPGQEVTLGILQPMFKTIEEEHVVELQEKKYETETRYDNNMLIGQRQVIQQGENGVDKVTKKVQKSNGAILSAYIANTEEVKPAIKEIIVKGGKSGAYGYVGDWFWPTKTPYIITSPFGWRWGALHDAVDIAGTGYGSPIMAANGGKVVESTSKWPNGQYVTIDHGNGYYTLYAHLSVRYVSVGQTVQQGEVIGGMGHSGWATGTHLHFAIWKGYPYRGGTPLNPLGFY